MAVRSDSFRVVFEVQNDGTIKAAFADVGKGAQDAGRQVDQAGDKWEAFGNRIGSALRIGGGIAAAGLALIIKNTIQAEQELAQLDAILRSTGNAAGYSRDMLVSMANELSQKSIFSGGEIIEAQTRLLSYSGVLGENIPRAMQAVIDQSARLGISVTQSAETIGRALESPSKAAAALAQQGFGAAFTDEVRKTIKALEEQGREAEAQQIILGILEESYAGAAEAARNTLGGAAIALKNTLMDLTTGSDGSLDRTTEAVNDLIDTLNDDQVRAGFQMVVDGAIDATGALAIYIGKIGEAIGAYRNWLAEQGFQPAQQLDNTAQLDERIRKLSGIVHGNDPVNTVRMAVFGDTFRQELATAIEERNSFQWRNVESGATTVPGARTPRPRGGGKDDDKKKKLTDEERAAQALARAYEGYNLQLLRSGELMEDNSNLAKLNFEIQHGSLKGLEPALADNLRKQAEFLDMQEQVAEHERIATEAREEHTEALRRQQEAYDDLIGSLQTELEIMGLSRVEANALLAIRRLGISETSAHADEIRGLYQAIEDNEQAIAAMDSVRSAGSDLLVDIGSGEDPFEALEKSADRLHQRLLQMVADNLMERLFGDFGSTGQGSGGGDWFGRIFGALFGGGGGSSAAASTAGSAAAGAVAGGGGWASLIGAVLGGGRAYGGDTRPNMLHEINEGGVPEVYSTAGGRRYLLTGNEHGQVQPLQDGGGMSLVVNQQVVLQGRQNRQTPGQFARETMSAATRATSKFS